MNEVRAALETLLNPAIPYEHAADNPNCGECWLCIYATVGLAHVLRSETERRSSRVGPWEAT